MLSSVLRSERAVRVNIEIMRAFVRLRTPLAGNADLARKLHALERRYDAQFKVVFDAIREDLAAAEKCERSAARAAREGRHDVAAAYKRGLRPSFLGSDPTGAAG